MGDRHDDPQLFDPINPYLIVPTKEMYEYAVQGSLGDAVYHEP